MSTGARVLVTVGSEHGSTWEIGERIAAVLTAAGLVVDLARPEKVGSLEAYNAAVIGSAVYYKKWLKPTEDLAIKHAAELETKKVWLFSSGLLNNIIKPPGEQYGGIYEIIDKTKARDHKVFAGKLDPAQFGWAHRMFIKVFRTPVGDFRDWREIECWAQQIAAQVKGGATVGAVRAAAEEAAGQTTAAAAVAAAEEIK